MTPQNIATTVAGVVVVAATAAAGLTAWLLVTAPTTVAMALNGQDGEPLVQVAVRALYDVLAGLIRYL